MNNKRFNILFSLLFFLACLTVPTLPVQSAQQAYCGDPKCRCQGCPTRANKKSLVARTQAQNTPNGGSGGSSSGQPWFSLLISLVMLGGGLLMIALLLRHTLQKAGMTWQPAYSSLAVVAILGISALVASSIWPTAAKRGQVAAKQLEAAPNYADTFTGAFDFGGNKITQIGGADYDAQGNLYVAGWFFGTLELTINGQPTTFTSGADADVYLAKFDANNNCLWARIAEGASGLPTGFSLDGALALAVDAQGAAYLGGGFVKSLNFKGNDGATVATLQDNNDDINFEPFVAKYDTSGTLAWAKGGDSGASDDAEATDDLDQGINGITEIVVGKNGQLFVAGTVAGSKFLGADISGEGESDTVIARLNPTTGVANWVQTAGGIYSDGALGMTIDDASNVYVIGYFDDIATFPTTPPTELDSQGYEDTFVTKFTANGQCQWVKQIGGTNDVIGTAIAVNGKGDLYMTGYFLDEAEFGTAKINSPDYISGFLVKWDTNCQYQWVRSFGQTADTISERINLDKQGNPFVQGIFFGEEEDAATAVFGAETPAVQGSLTTLDVDMYLAKYDAAGAFRWAKGIYATDAPSVGQIYSDEVPIDVLPLRVVQNRATGTMSLFGDFKGTLSLSEPPAVTAEVDASDVRKAFAARLVHTCPPLAFSSLPNAQVNQSYNTKITLTTGDNPAQFSTESAASLPPGLTLAADGTLSGTPTQPGTYTIKVNGTDAYDCGGSNTYQIVVSTYEADVAPRQAGNGAVSVADWTQVGRFVAGLDTVQTSEFQRADCAPRVSQGDGQLTISDWVQAGRYAAGLDSNIFAAGPAGMATLQPFTRAASFTWRAAISGSSVLRAVASTEPNTFLIQLETSGGDQAFGFSLQFDPTVISFAEASLESGLSGGVLVLNDQMASQGNLGVLASLPIGQSARAGTSQLLKLRFIPRGTQSSTPIRFSESLVKRVTVDVTSTPLATTYINMDLPLQPRAVRSDRSNGGRRTGTPRLSNR